MSAGALPQTPLTELTGLLAGFKRPTSKGGKGVRKGDGTEWEWTEEEGPQGLVHTQCPTFWKISWLQNWSDWQGRQHRRLPRAANTLAPPLRLSLFSQFKEIFLNSNIVVFAKCIFFFNLCRKYIFWPEFRRYEWFCMYNFPILAAAFDHNVLIIRLPSPWNLEIYLPF